MLIRLENEKASLVLQIENGKLQLKEMTSLGKKYFSVNAEIPHSVAFIIGKPYAGGGMFNRHSFGGEAFEYVSHEYAQDEEKQELTIEEKSEDLLLKTSYVLRNGCAVFECYKQATNISDRVFDVNCVAPLFVAGLFNEAEKGDREARSAFWEDLSISGGDDDGFGITKENQKGKYPYLWVANNMWCAEMSLERMDLRSLGLRRVGTIKKCGKISIASNGTHTTNRYMPMGILEKENYGLFFFEIIPEGSWSYELEGGSRDHDDAQLYLSVTGKNYVENAWYKTLQIGETYKTERVRFMGGEDFDALGEELTIIRRATAMKHRVKAYEQVIYNNFQQNTFGNANEKDDEIYIPIAAEYGSDYYVTDAGWHDYGEGGRTPTHEIGEWKESKKNYPSGLIKTVEKVRAHGMKFGLWLELQSVGYFCKNKQLLPEDCFFTINGARPLFNRRYQLDYSKQAVRDYADGIVKDLVERYNPEYIKIDYNQSQIANDCETGSPAEGMAIHFRAYNDWFEKIQEKYPNILFESCASGGMRNDENSCRLSAVISVTDQGAYYNYPFIMANMPLALLPEQSGVWNMPIRKLKYPETSDEEVIMNCVNSFYGVMHLASKLEALNEGQKALLKEGIAYYRKLAEIKAKAIPVFPRGVTMFDDEVVFIGWKYEKKLYVSVYNMLTKEQTVEQDFSKYGAIRAKLVYPEQAKNLYSMKEGKFVCEMEPASARSFEFELE